MNLGQAINPGDKGISVKHLLTKRLKGINKINGSNIYLFTF